MAALAVVGDVGQPISNPNVNLSKKPTEEMKVKTDELSHHQFPKTREGRSGKGVVVIPTGQGVRFHKLAYLFFN